MALDTSSLEQSITPLPEFAGILRTEQRYGDGRNDDAGDRLNNWFDALMLQAGLELAPPLILMLCVFAGVALGGLVFVIQEDLLTTAMAALIGFILPVAAAVFARSRRQNQILNQLAPMLDELARAAKTGRSVEQCLELVATDTPQPLGGELQLAARRLRLGVSLRDALRELPVRTGLNTLNLFAMSLIVHQQTGGDLVTVLERLSRVIRDRLLYLGRLQAATAASRATAILMVLLPPAILAFFTFRDPGYVDALLDSAWGRNATILALLLDVIGAVWVIRILKSSQRA